MVVLQGTGGVLAKAEPRKTGTDWCARIGPNVPKRAIAAVPAVAAQPLKEGAGGHGAGLVNVVALGAGGIGADAAPGKGGANGGRCFVGLDSDQATSFGVVFGSIGIVCKQYNSCSGCR